MKIGLVCPYNLLYGGGVQECVLATQAELSKLGHKALIITPQHREQADTLPDFVRVLGRSTDVKSLHTTAQISASVDTKQVDQLLTDEKFDVLHFHEPWVPMLSRQILVRSQSINIATFHAKLPDTVMHRTIERVITPYTGSILKYFQAFTAVSDAAASYLRSLTERTVDIIPNGIDLLKYRPLKLQAQTDTTIVYIGRLEKRKGLKYLLKAYALLSVRMPEAKLLIAGSGVDREKLEGLVHEWRLPNVHFLGQVSEQKKFQLLHEARVFCTLAPYGESFGIVLLEAMASGLPIVAADNPGYSSVLCGKGSLSLVNPKDSQAVARQLELIIKDEQLRSHWKDWARKEIPKYDYNKIVGRYLKLYDEQIEHHSTHVKNT